ncbi:RHS repeat domain-containing protein [Vibrio campbellii]|nr:RHS repeat domain-containing protein [Vibrio campbellii]
MSTLFSNTPSVTVLDNRGLSVRDIAYYRHPDEPGTTQTRITHHQYDIRGSLEQSADPRLHQSGKANFHYLTDLAGHVLRTQGVDNGTSFSLSDAAGRAFIAVNNISTAADGSEDKNHAVTRTWQYEGASLPGRLLSITEQVTGDAARITERFVYARNTEAEKAHNLTGQCISHYDTAGLVQTDSIALTGVALSVSRRLLKDVDNPDVVADWQGGDASVWNEQLSKEDYVTLTTTDATGTVLTTTDTKGNVQRVAYDVSGLMSGSWLTLKGKAEQTIVKSLMYSAAGQKLREEQGNGVVTTYSYEPETQRLIGIKTERPTGHALGAKVLQDLRYEYDPVGNVVTINNDAEETRFWRNQKVVPENTYTYDSLYQLVQATGREMANAGQQSNHLPSATTPFSSDSSAYTNYTRTYTYDEAGNLIKVSHSAPATSNNYTTTLTVSDSSNRSVQSTLTENASDVDGFFTVGGQQKQLQLGQHLIWTPRNELLKVTPVVRDGDMNDVESYRYDAGSQRLLKVSKQKAANTVQTLRALYLPGVELRSVTQDNTETESLQVITLGEAGRAQVRVLHWEKGGPSEISNDQVRYSYDSLIGSCNLEVDSSGHVISMEEYYPYGGTAILTARNQTEVKYKTVRYSGKERDATGLYYYGYRYYQPWVGRWLSSDPAGTVDGLNLYRMVRNNPIKYRDPNGLLSAGSALKGAKGALGIYDKLSNLKGNVKSTIKGLPLPAKVALGIVVAPLAVITVALYGVGAALKKVGSALFNKSIKKTRGNILHGEEPITNSEHYLGEMMKLKEKTLAKNMANTGVNVADNISPLLSPVGANVASVAGYALGAASGYARAKHGAVASSVVSDAISTNSSPVKGAMTSAAATMATVKINAGETSSLAATLVSSVAGLAGGVTKSSLNSERAQLIGHADVGNKLLKGKESTHNAAAALITSAGLDDELLEGKKVNGKQLEKVGHAVALGTNWTGNSLSSIQGMPYIGSVVSVANILGGAIYGANEAIKQFGHRSAFVNPQFD